MEGTNLGMTEDLVRVFPEDLPGEGMTHMFGDADGVANTFLRFGGGKVAIFAKIVNFLPKIEAEKGADVGGDTSEHGKGNTANGVITHVVEEEAGVSEAEKPTESRSTSAIHDAIGGVLDHLEAALGGVLLLLVGFTLPGRDKESTEDGHDLLADVDLGAITEKARGGTACLDVVFKGVHQLLVIFETVDVSDSSVGPHTKRVSSGAIIDSRRVRADNVHGDGFRMTGNIEDRILRLEHATQICANGKTGPLGGVFKHLANEVNGAPPKEGAQSSEIGVLLGDGRGGQMTRIIGVEGGFFQDGRIGVGVTCVHAGSAEAIGHDVTMKRGAVNIEEAMIKVVRDVIVSVTINAVSSLHDTAMTVLPKSSEGKKVIGVGFLNGIKPMLIIIRITIETGEIPFFLGGAENVGKHLEFVVSERMHVPAREGSVDDKGADVPLRSLDELLPTNLVTLVMHDDAVCLHLWGRMNGASFTVESTVVEDSNM